MAEPIKYAVGPDGRIVQYEPHHQALKPGWREATDEDIAALVAKREPKAEPIQPPPLPEPEPVDAGWPDVVIHESVVELTSE